MKRKYPRISGRKKLVWVNKLPDMRVCAVCHAPAVYRCEIQVNWFRGDDEAENRCEEHSKAEADQL